MPKDNLVYGIDFGTSNSAVAITDEDGNSKILEIDGKRTTPSLIFFPDNETGKYYIGFEAISKYLESGMKGRFIQSIKSVLPSDLFTGTNINGFGVLTSEDLVSMILKNLKEKADAISGSDTKNVVIGRPARFSDKEKLDELAEERLLIAAKKAGFTNISFQLEPIAAALYYESSLNKEELVLVADIGGGTSDFTIMKLSPDKRHKTNRQSDILASGGVYIGGDSFNSDIMRWKLLEYFGYGSELKTLSGKMLPFPSDLLSQICRWQDVSFIKNRETEILLNNILYESTNKKAVTNLQTLINEDLSYLLFQEIEKAKIGLSKLEQMPIDFNKSKININEKINREEFEDLIDIRLKKINDSVEDVIKIAGVTNKSIDAVFITGGSSLIPAIREIFAKKFGEEKIVSSDSFTSVASGLALSSK
jgi:hypothetical chaperone protein